MVDVSEMKSEYASRTSASSQKLVRRYVNKTGKLEAAASDHAQKNYISGVTDPEAQKRRQTNLRKLSESELNAAMEAKGGSAYAAGTSAAQDKWAKNVTPYLENADKIVASLPPRSRDPIANVNNRLIPLVKAQSDLKKKLG